jgi:hypothetical protein
VTPLDPRGGSKAVATGQPVPVIAFPKSDRLDAPGAGDAYGDDSCRDCWALGHGGRACFALPAAAVRWGRDDRRDRSSSRGALHGIRTTGSGWSAPFAGDPRKPPSGQAATQQRPSLPAGPTDGGGDHRGHAGRRDGPDGLRLRGAIVMLWRAGLRISEALALAESDLDRARGALLVRRGKGDRRREAGMDRWGWEQLDPWLAFRSTLPVCALFCVLRGATRGAPCAPAGIRMQLQKTARGAGVRRRFAPHQLRHAHAVEMSREGISLVVIQRQLGHADLGITSAYLRGIDNTESIRAVHERPTPHDSRRHSPLISARAHRHHSVLPRRAQRLGRTAGMRPGGKATRTGRSPPSPKQSPAKRRSRQGSDRQLRRPPAHKMSHAGRRGRAVEPRLNRKSRARRCYGDQAVTHRGAANGSSAPTAGFAGATPPGDRLLRSC